MKKYVTLQLTLGLFALLVFSACSRHKYYTSSYFEQQTANHRVIAILPAEMIFTGTQPKNITPEQIAQIEENESKSFQNSLYNGILRHANTKKYFTTISVQDISTTLKLLDDNKISVRDSWTQDDKKLAELLKVDAVVRMRIQKKRYMSDLASYGIAAGQQVLNQIGGIAGVPLPHVTNKTNDIQASCNVVSNNKTLWNDNYQAAANYNNPTDVIIDNITDNFGRNFPYKRRR